MKNNKYFYLNKCIDYAKSKGGLLLSTEYINAKEKLEWKCHKSEHKSFFNSYEKVLFRNYWCSECLK